ncbi:hypothetical protein ES703_115788 [subsurface metagenome]
MSIYKSPINVPKTGHELITCHYPLRIDTYSSCYHNCEYCYARSMLSDRNLWTPENVRMADINEIKSKIELYLGGVGNGLVAKAIQNRIPARLGGLTDCFQPIEEEKQTTLQLLKYLNSIDYPYLIVTKSDLISDCTYLSELRKDLAYVQITITTLNEKTARRLEPNAPSPERRIKALSKLNNAGVYSAGRVSPIIPNITDRDCFEVIERMIEIKVPHIIFEVFRGSDKMVKRIERATGLEIEPLQKRGVYYRFPSKEKEALYEAIVQKMIGSKTNFSFCSDGDPVPFSYHSTKNCCGTDAIKLKIPDTKFNMGNEKVASNLYYELNEKRTVRFEDLNRYFSLSDDLFRQAWNNGFLSQYVPNCEWDRETNTYTYTGE